MRGLRPLLFCLAWLALLIGIVGIFVPLLPTTPFVLLSCWLFSKSSSRFHQWLLNHRTFGPSLRDWEREGVIGSSAKWMASVMIISSGAYVLTYKLQGFSLRLLLGISLTVLLIFLWSRPSRKADSAINR